MITHSGATSLAHGSEGRPVAYHRKHRSQHPHDPRTTLLVDVRIPVARGLAGSSVVADAFVSLLPNIVDRWRSQAVPFVVAIDGSGERLRAALLAANREMERAGSLPWAQPGTGAVDVILHGAKGSRERQLAPGPSTCTRSCFSPQEQRHHTLPVDDGSRSERGAA